MEKGLFFLVLLLFSFNFVFSAENDGWDVVNSNKTEVDNSKNVLDFDNKTLNNINEGISNFIDSDYRTSYTKEFYIALGILGMGALIILFFLYIFLRSPKNKWRKVKKN